MIPRFSFVKNRRTGTGGIIKWNSPSHSLEGLGSYPVWLAVGILADGGLVLPGSVGAVVIPLAFITLGMLWLAAQPRHNELFRSVDVDMHSAFEVSCHVLANCESRL